MQQGHLHQQAPLHEVGHVTRSLAPTEAGTRSGARNKVICTKNRQQVAEWSQVPQRQPCGAGTLFASMPNNKLQLLNRQ